MIIVCAIIITILISGLIFCLFQGLLDYLLGDKLAFKGFTQQYFEYLKWTGLLFMGTLIVVIAFVVIDPLNENESIEHDSENLHIIQQDKPADISIFTLYDVLDNEDGYFFYAIDTHLNDIELFRYNLIPIKLDTCRVVSTRVIVRSKDEDPKYFALDDECPELTREYCPPINPNALHQPYAFINGQGCAYMTKIDYKFNPWKEYIDYYINRNILDKTKHICFRRETEYTVYHAIKDETISCINYKASLEKQYNHAERCRREKERNKLKGLPWTKKDQKNCMLPKQISENAFNELTTLKIIEPTDSVDNIKFYRGLADFRKNSEQEFHQQIYQ